MVSLPPETATGKPEIASECDQAVEDLLAFFRRLQASVVARRSLGGRASERLPRAADETSVCRPAHCRCGAPGSPGPQEKPSRGWPPCRPRFRRGRRAPFRGLAKNLG